MTTLDLEAIKARIKSATPGPWEVWNDREITQADTLKAFVVEQPATCRPADAEFIAHARTDVEALVAEVERLLAREASVLPLLIEVMAWLVNDQVRGPFNASREALIQRLSAALDGDFARLDEAQAEREEAIERQAKAGALREVLQMVRKHEQELRRIEHGTDYAVLREAYQMRAAEVHFIATEIESLLPQEPTK